MNMAKSEVSSGRTTRVDLVLTGAGVVHWGLGKVLGSYSDIGALSGLRSNALDVEVDAIFFWNPALGQPPEGTILELLRSPSDLWHAGLLCGMGPLPRLLDYVSPTWMLNCNAPSNIESTSWRISFQACLVRRSVVARMGLVRADFETLDAAGLEWGHRLQAAGVLMRHVPQLMGSSPPRASSPSAALPFQDELNFIYLRHGRKWAGWAVVRSLMNFRIGPIAVAKAWRHAVSAKPSDSPKVYWPTSEGRRFPSTIGSSFDLTGSRLSSGNSELPKVTVLIPTVDRYPYVRTLLEQLRKQTVPPCEIILIDQTHRSVRDLSIAADFADLPLKVIVQDEAGQCSSRNAGLEIMQGDYVLFIDDDDEVDPDLIERHLVTMAEYDVDSCSGVSNEVGAENFQPKAGLLCISDVFPTNNTLVKRSALEKSGLFDLAYNRGQRADGDLGMRVYLSGAKMVLNTDISVLHHHAPSGGLRKHKARVVTYASSRKNLFHRNLPSATEIYLGKRYFTPAQGREAVWLRVLGTFSARGGTSQKIMKVCASCVLLPHTLWKIYCHIKKGREMTEQYPKIAVIGSAKKKGTDD